MRRIKFVVLIVSAGLLWIGRGDQCEKMALKQQEKSCNPALAEVVTAILATTTDNYTRVCSAVEDYVTCMEPHVLDCDPTLIYRYWHNKEIYTGEPYHCNPILTNITFITPTGVVVNSRVVNGADLASSGNLELCSGIVIIGSVLSGLFYN